MISKVSTHQTLSDGYSCVSSSIDILPEDFFDLFTFYVTKCALRCAPDSKLTLKLTLRGYYKVVNGKTSQIFTPVHVIFWCVFVYFAILSNISKVFVPYLLF